MCIEREKGKHGAKERSTARLIKEDRWQLDIRIQIWV